MAIAVSRDRGSGTGNRGGRNQGSEVFADCCRLTPAPFISPSLITNDSGLPTIHSACFAGAISCFNVLRSQAARRFLVMTTRIERTVDDATPALRFASRLNGAFHDDDLAPALNAESLLQPLNSATSNSKPREQNISPMNIRATRPGFAPQALSRIDVPSEEFCTKKSPFINDATYLMKVIGAKAICARKVAKRCSSRIGPNPASEGVKPTFFEVGNEMFMRSRRRIRSTPPTFTGLIENGAAADRGRWKSPGHFGIVRVNDVFEQAQRQARSKPFCPVNPES